MNGECFLKGGFGRFFMFCDGMFCFSLLLVVICLGDLKLSVCCTEGFFGV